MFISWFVNSIDLLESLRKYPVFDAAQFASSASLDPGSAKVRLFRMKKECRIVEIHRNSYTVFRDPLIVASRIVWPSYISLWYALSHHGMTSQVPHGIAVVTTRGTFRKHLDFLGTTITFIRVPPSFLYGYDRIIVGGHEVFMAYPEKAIVDAIHLKMISASEVFEMIRGNERVLDLKRLVEFVSRSNDGDAMRRIGFMLYRMGRIHDMRLRGRLGGTAVPLDPSLPPEGPLIKRWGIIDNLGVER
jgi:predicted transcriptional regulator of viral defense system